jgi:hypothetical protein
VISKSGFGVIRVVSLSRRPSTMPRRRRSAFQKRPERLWVTNAVTNSGNPKNAYIEAMEDATTGTATPTADDNEATGSQLNDVEFAVNLAVTFQLK